MFDGRSEARPRVSMRGNRRGPEKGSILRRAKQERENRAAERQRSQAAVVLQRFFRGRRDVGRTRLRVRSGWDLKMRDLDKVARVVAEQTQQRFRPPISVLMQLLREFLFCREVRDPKRTALIATLAALGAEQDDFVTQLDCAQLPSATLTVAAFVRVALQQLDASDAETAESILHAVAVMSNWLSRGEDIGARAFAHLDLALTIPAVSFSGMAQTLNFSLNRLSQMYRLSRPEILVLDRLNEFPQLLQVLVWPLLESQSSSSFPSSQLSSSSASATQSMRAQLLDLGFESLALAAFTSSGRSLPAFAERVSKIGDTAVALFLDRVCVALQKKLRDHHSPGEMQLSPAEVLQLVQNFAALKAVITPACKASFLRLAGVLLSFLPVRYAARARITEAGYDVSSGPQVAASLLERDFRAAMNSQRLVYNSSRTQPELVNASNIVLELVTSEDFLRASPISSTVEETSELFAHICLLDMSLLKNTGGALDHVEEMPSETNYSGPILRALAFQKGEDRHPLHVLWDYLETKSSLRSYCQDAGVDGSVDRDTKYPLKAEITDERTMPVLLTYMVGLSHALIAADDEDFFLHAKPVSVRVALQTIRLVKAILHTLLWTSSVALGNLSVLSVALVASRLVRQLRERSSRLKISQFSQDVATQLFHEENLARFANDAMWDWPPSTVNSIMANLLRNDIASEDDAVNILQHIDPSFDIEEDEQTAMELEEDKWADQTSGGAARSRETQASVDARISRILRDVPDLLPFQSRVRIFKSLVKADKRVRGALPSSFTFYPRTQHTTIRVRRGHIFEDSFKALSMEDVKNKPLRGRIQVTFVNEHGMEEAGIDGGGLLKEWMDAICKEVFDPSYGFFVLTGSSEDSVSNQVTPSYASGVLSSEHLEGFRFAGRVLGKALYEGILVEPRLASPFINKLLGRYNHVDDLKFLDQSLHRGLMSMKKMALGNRDSEHDGVQDLGLNFQVSIDTFGAHREVDLLAGGEHIMVTSHNALQYIHLLAHFKLNVLTKAQSEAVLRGFRELIPECWLRLFNAPEVQLLIGGDGYHPVDLIDLKANCAYSGGYHPSQPYIQAFWRCIDEFSPEEMAKFLSFVTSCSRQPLLGFGSLSPQMCIQKVPHEPVGKLPSAATCMNLLKLPQYDDVEMLKSKLLYAISSNAGFDLS